MIERSISSNIERLHIIRPDGGYCGTFSWGTALEVAAEGGCYAMDTKGLRVVVRDGGWTREPMPSGVIACCERSVNGGIHYGSSAGPDGPSVGMRKGHGE